MPLMQCKVFSLPNFLRVSYFGMFELFIPSLDINSFIDEKT